MDPQTFSRLREIVYQRSGISLSSDKETLLRSRLQKRLRTLGLSNESQYLQIVETDLDGAELLQLIDAVATNTTYFWREPEHFTVFGEYLSELKGRGQRRFRIWCAASSSGEEPYTLAMEVHQRLGGLDAKILATDISNKILLQAQEGIYSSESINNLPADKRRCFQRIKFGEEDRWKILPAIQGLVTFRKLNLVEHPYPLSGPLDVIFCRNVMIYFDRPTRQKIINDFARLLAPGGLLFLSLSESLLGLEHDLERADTSVFRRKR
jgi:chemotaxis protein methyltransferase CheR